MAAQQSRPGEMIQGINVTPLVDVVLVLLIVLMVAASYTVSQSLPLDLPRAKSGQTENTALAISIDEKGQLYVDGAAASEEQLIARVRQQKSAQDVSVLLAADGRTQHKSVVRIMDVLRVEGVTKFAINVAPEDLTQ